MVEQSKPSPSGEVEKVIRLGIAELLQGYFDRETPQELLADMVALFVSHRTTYAEDNERLRATVETLQFGERMHNERAEAAQAEIERLRAILADPNAVHINMLNGTIAKPSIRQMLHLHGEEALAKWAQAEEMRKALEGLPGIIAEIHREWDRGMKAGKLLIALMDPSLKYRADVTAIHEAIARTALMKGGE
jgi:hypothetical protein